VKIQVIILLALVLISIVIILNRDSYIDSIIEEKEKYELEIENSRLKQQKLLEEIKILKDNFQILANKRDTINNQIVIKEIERIEIIKYVDSQIKNINDISIDSTILFLTNRLSSTNLN